MNTKTLIIIFIVAIVVLGGASALLLLNNQKQKPSSSSSSEQPALKAGTPTKNLVELQNQGWVKDVVIGLLGDAIPSTLKIEKNWAVRFTNQSTKDIEINIIGDKDLMVVKIPAGKNMMSPIFMNSGSYKYSDAKNTKIKGEIIVGNPSSQSGTSSSPSTSLTKPAVELKNVSVVIDSSGFSPNKVTIKTDTLISFDNKLGKDFYFLQTSDMPPMPNVIPSNIKVGIEFKEGQYKLVNKNDRTQTLEIVVNK